MQKTGMCVRYAGLELGPSSQHCTSRFPLSRLQLSAIRSHACAHIPLQSSRLENPILTVPTVETPDATANPVEKDILPWIQPHPQFAERIHGQLILAPLTKYGNVPFRRLAVAMGAKVTMGEMVFSKTLLGRNFAERTRLRQAPNENFFGAQMATKTIDEGVRCAEMAAAAGASWIDLNCGCPIHEATKRGLGARLLERPAKLQRLVEGIARDSPIPLTVKIRIGTKASNINAEKVVRALEAAGAAAVSIHGRTQQQRYTKAADWDCIAQVAAAAQIPVIGNGDILTLFEAKRRMQQHQCIAVMAGRGALVKPWLFQEWQSNSEWFPTASERVGVYRQLVAYQKEYFGDDAMGRKKAWHFLPATSQTHIEDYLPIGIPSMSVFRQPVQEAATSGPYIAVPVVSGHLGWFCRYRPLPEDLFAAASEDHPLIATRQDVVDQVRQEDLESIGVLERLLRCSHDEAHQEIASILWDSDSDATATQQLTDLAQREVSNWEAIAAAGTRDDRDVDQRLDADAQG